MRIPDETIQQIRNATDIVEYIGRFVKLKKRGKNWIGLCPFHSEKTPSFNVSADKQMYYCFGCQRGGDVIKFVMEWDKTSYVEAIELLAERAGVVITRTDEAYENASEIEKLFNVCTFAARAFNNDLRTTEEGKFALEYFRTRGFSDKTITTFGLGYSLRAWESLLEEANKAGIDPAYLEKVGLIKKRDDGSFYDVFRGRAMFPIFSPIGRVIAFGARKLYDDDNLGKYINSPETPIYHKSKTLYGLSQAKESIRERGFVVLVEGYADLISVFQAGTRNSVASSGTALTVEQIQLLSRYTKAVTLVYDADSAGVNAMMRGVDVILENGLDVRIVNLPQGEDPDSFVRKNGGEAFEMLLSKAISFIEYKAETFRLQGKFESPEGRAEAIRGLVQTIALIKDPLRQSFFIKDVADKYRLYESTLYAELERSTKKLPEKFTTTFVKQVNESEKAEPAAESAAVIPIEERELFGALLEDPGRIIPFVFTHLRVSDLSTDRSQRLATLLLNEFDEHGTIEPRTFIERLADDDLRRLVSDISFNRYELGAKWSSVGARESETRIFDLALGSIKSIKKKQLKRQLAANRAEMEKASLNSLDQMPFQEREREILGKIKTVEGMKLTKSET